MNGCYGRQREISLLEDQLKKDSSITILYGPKGIGLSTLLRHLHHSLLKRRGIVVGYTKVYKGRDPFSHLFANLLLSLYDELIRIGGKGEVSSIFSSLRSHLGGLRKRRAGRALLFNIRCILKRNGFRDLLRLSQPLWGEFRLEDAMVDPLHALSVEDIFSFINGFKATIKGNGVVLIIDDVDYILDERPDILKAITRPQSLNIHFVYSMDEGMIKKVCVKEEDKIQLRRVDPITSDGIMEWMGEEAPGLLESIGLTDLINLSKGHPFTLSEWIKQEVKEGVEWERFIDQIFERYDYPSKRFIAKIALMRYPLSVSEYGRLFGIGEDATRRYLMRFEDDFLISRVYLEGEDVFWFEHPLKQERILELAKMYLNMDEVCEEIASFFEHEISYPTEDGGFCFFGNLKNTIHYYGLLEGEEPLHIKGFYEKAIDVFEKGSSEILELIEHPYFKGLKTRFKLIIYALLAETRRIDPSGFRDALSKLEGFASERKGYIDFQIEYARALFYLSNRLGIEERFREIDLLVENFSSLVYDHPEIKEVKLIFSTMLFNLSYDLSKIHKFDRVKRVLEVLGELVHRNPEELEIRLSYMRALSGICYRIGEAKRFGELPSYIDIQRSILEMDRNPDEIKIEHAKTLCNASLHFGMAKRFEDIGWVLESLRRLMEENPDIAQIRCEYAKALSNASSLYSRAGRFNESNGLIEALATLTVKEGSREMDEVYLSSLFNLSSDLGDVKRFDLLKDILKRMQRLISKPPIQDEIILAYAKALYNASYDLDEKGMFDLLLSNISQLMGLLRKKRNPEIEILCIRTIFNATTDLMKVRRFEDVARILSTIERLTQDGFMHPQAERLLSQLLFNLVSYLSKNLNIGNLKRACGLLKMIGNEDIYLDAMVNAVAYFGKGEKVCELKWIMDEIEELSNKGLNMASHAYAKALTNLSNLYGKNALFKELYEVIEKAQRLYLQNPELKGPYLDILVNACVYLAKKDDLGELMSIIARLEEFYKSNSGDEEAGVAYAKALVTLYNALENREDLEGMHRIWATLEEIAKANPYVMALLEAIEFPLY